MNEEEIKKIKKDLHRYRTLYEITLEENKLLKENYILLQNTINQQTKQESQEISKKSIVYRGLRKIYRMIKR